MKEAYVPSANPLGGVDAGGRQRVVRGAGQLLLRGAAVRIADFLLWDGATAASPALDFTITDRIFTADPSGELNGLLVTVTSALGPIWVPAGTYNKMTMLWYEPTRSFNITGSYCVDLAGCTTDGFADINVRSHVGEGNYDPHEPAPILLRVDDVPEPASIVLVAAGLGAAVGRRRRARSAP